MNTRNNYVPSLNDLVRFLHVKPVLAKSCSPTRKEKNESSATADAAGGGDVPTSQKYSPCGEIHNIKTDTASNRGKTGAGVTGSRKRRCREKSRSTVVEVEDVPAKADDVVWSARDTNPGLLRHIHNAARHRLPQCFEGATISVKQGAKSNWILGHCMSFSSVSPGGYKVLLSHVDKVNADTTVPYFVMEAAPGGQMSCEFRVSPSHGTRATLVAQIADKELYNFESILDAYFNSSTASIIAVNREYIALHYLKAITNHISVGGEMVARGQGDFVSSASGAARWADEDNSLSATLGNRGLDFCFAKNIHPYLTVAAMLEVGFAVRRAVATLAYEWNTDEWTVRGSMDSDGLVGATLHRALGGKRAKLACAISALLNHPNDKFRLGFGVTATLD